MAEFRQHTPFGIVTAPAAGVGASPTGPRVPIAGNKQLVDLRKSLADAQAVNNNTKANEIYRQILEVHRKNGLGAPIVGRGRYV